MAYDTILTDRTGINGIPQFFDTTGAPKPLTGDKAPYSQVVDVSGVPLFTVTNPGRLTLTTAIPAGGNNIGSVNLGAPLPAGTNLIGVTQHIGNLVDTVLLNGAVAAGVGPVLPINAYRLYRFETWGVGTYTVQIQVNASNGSGTYYPLQPKNLNSQSYTATVTGPGVYEIDMSGFSNIQANVTALSGSVAEVASLAVSSAPTASGNVTVTLDGVATNVAVTTGLAEVDSLQITNVTGATTSGNVTVTLDGVATNVAVSAGVAEVDTLTVTSAVGAAGAGNVTVTLNGVAVNVAVANSDTIAMVHDKIRATAFTGWTTGGAAGAAVTFTSTTVGTRTAPTYAPNATGAAGNIVVTTAGVNADNTAALVATKIRAAVFTGWTTGGTTDTVTFTSNTIGVRTAPVYSAGTTGAAGTITRTTTGVAADAAVDVATKIRNTVYTGWTTGGTTTTVTFTSNAVGARIDATYTPNATGAAGTMTTTTQGVTASVSVKGKFIG